MFKIDGPKYVRMVGRGEAHGMATDQSTSDEPGDAHQPRLSVVVAWQDGLC